MTDYQKSKLPFNIVSSSANTGYITEISSGFKPDVDIVGHHQDVYAGLENQPLQSPFTNQHVGGNQHRHTPLNTGADNDFSRAEAFKIKPESGQLKIYGPDFEDVNKPRAQIWLGAKSPINVSNVQSSGNIAGNFEHNYQVVQSSGRRITNNLIVDGFEASGNLTTQFITGAHNYTLPDIIRIDAEGKQYKDQTTFVERFNAPGGKEESSRGALDRAGEELSPNNSLTTRNIKVRQPLYSQLTQHSAQFGSGSSEGISKHKVNRNSLRRIELDGDNYVSSSLYDNFWVQHSIPRDNFGYAWITGSSISNPYTIGTGSLQYDFSSSLSAIKDKVISLDTQTINASLSGSDNYYSTWKQTRTAEHPVARKLKENNLISIQDQSIGKNSLQQNSLNISKRSGTSTNFREPLVSNKNYPLQQELRFVGEPSASSTKLKYTFKNNSSRFANEDLDIRLGLTDKVVEFYDKLVKANKLEQNSPINDVLSIDFKETLYPKEVNTFLSEVRNREAYILNQAGTGSDGYDRRLGSQRVIWRDEQEDRRRTKNSADGHLGSLGYSSTLQSGSSFSVEEDSFLADEKTVSYTSSFTTDVGLDTNLFNSISALENSSSQVPAYTSKQLATFDGKTIFNRKQSDINYIAGELNEQFVDSYGTSGSADGFLKNSLGSIYRRSYYKSVTQQPPYVSGSVNDNIDSVVVIPTEDNEIQINPKPKYLAFLGGVQIVNNSNVIANFEQQEENIFEQPEEGFITEGDIVYSTIDNGLLRKTEEISGKKPFFDSYEEFISDARAMGQDYSILPEFRISQHMKYYVSSSGGNFRIKNNALFDLDGNGISNRSSLTEKSNFNVEFKNKYLDADELENNQIIQTDYSEDVSQNSISLTLKGIKKLLPYNGFYPQDRTLQMANLYSEYAESNLVGGLYNVSYEENTRDDKLFPHIETTASLNKVSSLSSAKFSSSLNGECFYIAVGHHNYDSNRGSVKIFRSTTETPFNDWNQESIVQYQGSTTECYFGQSVLLTTGSNGLNLFVTEFGQNKTGSIYQMTSSDGATWTSKTKINNITGSIGAYFGNYLDGLRDSTRTVLAITETGVPISFNGAVKATYLSGSDLYIGGNFTSVNGDSTSRYLVKLNTTSSTTEIIGGFFNGGSEVLALTGSGNRLFVGGNFTSIPELSYLSSRRLAVYDTINKTWIDAKLGSYGASVRTIHVSGADLYIGGSFSSVTSVFGVTSARRVLRIIDGATSNASSSTNFLPLGQDGSPLNGTDGIVYSINSFGSDVYIGGSFTSMYSGSTTTSVGNIAKWNTLNNTWSSLSASTLIQEGSGGNNFISASDKGTDDFFGSSIDLNSSGNRMFVGAFQADVSTVAGGGKVYIYNSGSSTGWSQETIGANPFISASDKYTYDQFGCSIAANSNGNGNTFVVGANGIVNYVGGPSIPYAPEVTVHFNTNINFYRQLSGSKSIISVESSPRGIFFNSDGTLMFVVGQTVPASVRRYTLSVPFKVDSAGASPDQVLNISSQVTSPRGITFSTSGDRMFVVGANSVFRFTLPAAYDISSFASVSSYNFGATTSPTGIALDPENMLMFVSFVVQGGSSNISQIRSYLLTSPNNITNPLLQSTLNVTLYQPTVTGLFFGSDGSELIICGEATSVINRFRLVSPYSPSVSSAVLIGSVDLSTEIGATGVQDIWVNPNKDKFYVLSTSSDRIYQYNIQNSQGKAYIYLSGTAGWKQDGAILTASDKAVESGFGTSVSIDGSGMRVAIGSPYSNISTGFIGSGKVYVYSSSSIGWREETIGSNAFISASDKASYNYFGYSLSFNDSSNKIAIGAPRATVGALTDCGKVYIYTSSSVGGWKEEAIGSNAFISASNKSTGAFFGYSVSMNSSGDKVAVGSIFANNTGRVYIYNSGALGWQQDTIISGDSINDYFGYSIKLNDSGNRLVVSSPGADISPNSEAGRVYVYTSGSSGWFRERNFGADTSLSGSEQIASAGDNYGSSVCINSIGNRIGIGSFGEDIVSNKNEGKVYVYSSSSPTIKEFWSHQGGLNTIVNSIILSGSSLYVGGNFTSDSLGYKPHQRAAIYSPSLDSFSNIGSTSFNGQIRTLKFSGSDLYAGGDFTSPGKYIAKWNGTTWSNITSDILNASVYNINISSSIFYAGGDFIIPSSKFGIYDSNISTWLSSDGRVHIITASNLSPDTWSAKTTVISGSNLAKYCSILSASNGYHIYTTDQSDDRGSIRVVSSSDGGTIWSSGTLGGGLIIRNGSNSTSELGNLPIDATVFVPTSGPSIGQERVYVFTADKGTSGNGSFYVFSSSINSNWNGVSPTAGALNSKIIKTGNSSTPIVSFNYNKNETNINISSLTASNVLYYAFGTPNENKVVYVGRSYDGQTFESEDDLYVSQPATRTTNYGENIDISNISNTIPVFFTDDYINVYSIVRGKFVIYRLNIEGYEKYAKHASLEPIFAPGILYNTIKSGIAVDWPCTTGSNVIVKTPGPYGLRSAFYPKNITIKTLDTEEGILNAQGALKSIINYRIPFENIIFPNELFEPKQEIKTNQYTLRPIDAPEISSTDIINQYLNKSYIYSGYESYIDPLEVTDLANLGPKRYSSPFVYRKLQTSDSGLYTLSISNFLAETIKFFLRDEKLTTFSSLPDNKWKQFSSGSTYYMDVVLEKTPELVMIEAYSSSAEIEPRNTQTFNGRYFGYPTNKTIKNVWTGSAFSLDESSQIHSDPAYAPYTPPYFEGIARARIAFTPTTTRAYKLEEILNQANVTNIFSGLEGLAQTGSDAYINKMPLESSVQLNGSIQAVNVTIRTDATGQEVSEDPNNKIWVISPKMETPVLDFSSQEFEQFENSYIKNSGYGRGMWSGYGEVPSAGKGIRLRVEYPFARIENEKTASLLEQVGFLAEEKNVGKIAENKIISEAIVIVPYLTKETNRTVKNKTSFRTSNVHFIKIDKKAFNEQRSNVENQTQQEQENSIADMIQKMKNYVIPPEMNFLEYSDFQPHVMYLFEFTHTLDQEDLSDIWQGVMPKISLNAEKDEITINHEFNKNELFGEEGLPAELKFLVFKVKKKAEYNYFNVTTTTKDDNRFQFNKIIGRKQGTDIYSYNWPYDYFSLVELAKVDIEINYKKKDK